MNSNNCQLKLQIKSKPSSQKVDVELYEEAIKTEIAFHCLPQISVSRFMKRVTNFQPRINGTAIGWLTSEDLLLC